MRRVPKTPRLLAAVAILATVATPALAATRTKAPPRAKVAPVTASRHLWATVDVCDSPTKPRVIGVRGSMPGTGLANERMFMRFQVQYQTGNAWTVIAKSDTGFRDVGAATFKARQSGQYFTIPAAATAYVLRGVISYQWRRRGHAVLRATRVTAAGHVAAAGSDPRGYSAAACALPAA